MSSITAGLVAGIPLAVVLTISFFLRKEPLLEFIHYQDENVTKLSRDTIFYLMLGGVIGASFAVGAVGGYLFHQLGLPNFRYLVYGGTLAITLLSLIGRNPVKYDRAFWTLAVGVIIGTFVPIFAG